MVASAGSAVENRFLAAANRSRKEVENRFLGGESPVGLGVVNWTLVWEGVVNWSVVLVNMSLGVVTRAARVNRVNRDVVDSTVSGTPFNTGATVVGKLENEGGGE